MAELHFDFLDKHGFDPFKGQFIINLHKVFDIDGFVTKKIGSWILQYHNSIPVFDIHDIDTGIFKGCLIGYNITSSLYPISENQKINIKFDHYDGIKEFLSDFNNSANGRFLGLLNFDSIEYIFNDYSASMTCICDIDNGIFSSSIWLQSRLGLNLNFLNSSYHSTQTPFQLSYLNYSNLHLLFPHSYLNLSNGKDYRYSMVLLNKHKPFLYSHFLQNVQYSMLPLRKNGNLNLLLSGGLDSRLLLACLIYSKVKFTVSSFHDTTINNKNTKDNRIAKTLSSKLNISHTAIDLSKDKNITVNRSYVTLIGYGGELGRSYLFDYLKMNENFKDQIGVHNLLEITRLPKKKIYKDKLDEWLQKYSLPDIRKTLDLFYIDFFIGHLNSPSLYQYDITCKFSFAPLMSNGCMKLFLITPPESKVGNELFIEIINNFCPQLLKVPFSS